MAAPMSVLLDGPALQPPKGITAHLTNRSSEQSAYYAFASLCTVVPGTLLLMRLYTKLRIFRKLDIVDYFVSLAFLLLLSLIVVGRLLVVQGGAVHQWNVQLKHYINAGYWFYVGEIIYGPTIFFVKAAILLQYQHMLAPTKSVNPLLFYSTWNIIALTLVYYIISTLGTTFACTPREKLWNPLITNGHCLHNDILVLITCLFNIISDIVILVLPARSVWRLRMPLAKKIPIILLFAIGVLACVANIMIIYYAVHLGGDNADVSYNAAFVGCWACVEIGLGICVTCALTLPKFYEAEGKKLGGIFSSLMRPFSSFASHTSFLRSNRSRQSGSKSRTQNGASDMQGPSDPDLSLNLTTCHLSWHEVPPLPKNIVEDLRNQQHVTNATPITPIRSHTDGASFV